MENIGERAMWRYIPGTDVPMPLGGLNHNTVLNTVIVIFGLWALMWLMARRRSPIPGRAQMSLELFVGMFDNLVASSLELHSRRANRAFLPLIAGLFIFLVVSNCLGFFPFRFIAEPTGDINTTLALGIMSMAVATWCGIRAKSARGYFTDLLGPLWSQEADGPAALIMGKLSALFFFPLNVIGEMAKVVSISFRLFGNILGSAIIVTVVSFLVYHMVLPIGLSLFFIFFTGIVQAFVFTMLTLTYIAVAIK